MSSFQELFEHKKKYLLAIILLLPQFFWAQTINHWSFNEEFSFRSTHIYDFLEAKNGHIWIGSNKGLFEFDGVEVKHFINRNFEFEYTTLEEDPEGRIWCHNFSGQVFHTSGDSLIMYEDLDDVTNTWTQQTVGQFPWIYFSSSYGLLRKHFHSESWEQIIWENDRFSARKTSLDSLERNFWFRNLVSIGDQIAIDLNKGLMIINPDLSFIQPKGYLPPTKKGLVYFYSSESFLWVISQSYEGDGALQAINNGKIERCWTFPEGFHIIQSIRLDEEENRVIFGTPSGVLSLDWEVDIPSSWESDLLELNIGPTMIDREGNLWIGSLGKGVLISPLKRNRLNEVAFSGKRGLGIRLLERGEQGEVFAAGSNNSLFRIESNGDVNPMVAPPFIIKSMHYLSPSRILCINNLKTSIDIELDRFSHINNDGLTKHILRLDNDTLIVTYTENTSRVWGFPFNIKGELIRAKRSTGSASGKTPNSFYANYSNGIIYYIGRKAFPIKWKNQPLICVSIAEATDDSGAWAMGVNGGLFRVEEQMVRKVAQFDEVASKMLAWKDQLFLATPSGVLKFTPSDSSVSLISTIDGLPTNEISDLEIFQDSLLIATPKGLFSLPCSYDFSNTIPPLIRITGLEVMGNDTTVTDNLQFSHNQNFINISFHGMAVRSRGTFTYRYRMLGLSEDWTELGSNTNTARFPSLSPGNYQFEVQAVNESGVQSESTATLSFFISKPIYERIWFLILGLLLFIGIVGIGYNQWNRVINRRKEETREKQMIAEKLVGSQLAALRSQMNPHFIFNALNSIQDYILSNQKELAGDYLGKFADLMRIYLNHSKLETLSLADEIEALELYLDLEKLRFEDTLKFSLEVDETMDQDSIQIPSLIIQPYVENAIKHGLLHKQRERLLKISFTQKGNTLICHVEDNGVGRAKSTEINSQRRKGHESHATSAIQKRISLLNKSLKRDIKVKYHDLLDVKGKALGTLVEIRVPV